MAARRVSKRLSRHDARRVALDAAGLTRPRPAGTPNVGHVSRVVQQVGALQIDSVNVLERAHLLTLFTRLGPFDPGLLDRALAERRVFEYWARMASFVPIEDYPLFRHRMERRGRGEWPQVVEVQRRAPGYVEAVYREVLERGPLTVADLEEPGDRQGPWWGWADGKIALEYLFSAGRVSVAFRRNFVRYYDVTERVIPEVHRNGSALSRDESQRRLLLRAGRALGVATAKDLMDHYWMRAAEARPLLADLVAEGELIEVEVEGWGRPALLHPTARAPRAVDERRLLNPFDPYMWNRERVERLHGFQYRIEIYVPRSKRVHGYYVLPFLLGDDLQARVDLKADRAGGRLAVLAAYLEPDRDAAVVARALLDELEQMARWLGLEVSVAESAGDLAPALVAARRDRQAVAIED